MSIAANTEAFLVSELATEPPFSVSFDQIHHFGEMVVAIHPGDFDGDGADDVLFQRVDSGVYFGPNYDYPNNAGVIASDEISDLTHVVGLGLALATTSDTKLVEILEIDNLTLGCVSSPGLPASTRVVGGDFADNEGDELAVVDDQGMIRVWARSP